MKKTTIFTVIFALIFALLVGCAVPSSPTPSDVINEEQVEPETGFHPSDGAAMAA